MAIGISGRILISLGLLIVCSAIMLYCWYVVVALAVSTLGPIMGSGGRVRFERDHPGNGVVDTTYKDQKLGDLKMHVTYKDHKMHGEMTRHCANAGL